LSRDLRQARSIALNLLPEEQSSYTREEIETAVRGAFKAQEATGQQPGWDPELLTREIEAQVTIFVGYGTALDDAMDHVPWLPQRRGEDIWHFWDRYRTYLLDDKQYPPSVVRRIDELTDDVLSRLEDPNRTGPWDRRGMVVGQVQSGKTSNYAGLICKAADAGYRLIVVLAGSHNSLRSQTQLRLDEAFLGFDTQQERFFDQTNRRIGVGRLPTSNRLLAVSSLTNSEEKGDFNLTVAKQVGFRIGSDPVLLVVKKNASILRNLVKWVTTLHQEEHPETGRLVVPELPLLVIDDEADQASVNTKDVSKARVEDEELDPTRINGLIRQLLHSFEQSAYVGYTATPFANIFIFNGEPSPTYGDDLFPRNFITRLPSPSNHVGPPEVFGIRSDPAAGLEQREGLPILRDVSDADAWMPEGHKKDWVPGAVPPSLKKAIHSFILACAVRAARGQGDQHNSMLIHVTRLVAVQEQVFEQISEEMETIRYRLRYGDGEAPEPILGSLERLWHDDFVPTAAKFDGDDLVEVGWDEVWPYLPGAAGRIEVTRINGTAKDALDYYDHPEGRFVIAVGGDKLSRGLTLEGLSVSYFLRASKMYDTLMQMGRWFGYRPGYIDVCRLFTTRELSSWYRDITAANEELLLLFDEMAAVGGTPEDFGLRVRKHPDGLLVTARAKMRNGKSMSLSFAGSVVETVGFPTNREVHESNLRSLQELLGRQGQSPTAENDGNLVARDVSGRDVADFLDTFKTYSGAHKAQGYLLARYIRDRLASGELEKWYVHVVGPAGQGPDHRIAGRPVRLTQRSGLDDTSTKDVYRIRRLGSPSDEFADFDEQQRQDALDLTRSRWQASPRSRDGSDPPGLPNGPAIRATRSPRRGLLSVYLLDPARAFENAPDLAFPSDFPAIPAFLVSFPDSEGAPAVEYVVPNTYWDEEQGRFDI
jgi:hypothetical protein